MHGMYAVPTPTPHYDTNFKDFVHPSYAGQFNDQFNTGYGEPSYHQYSNQFDEILEPTFQAPNGALYYRPPDGGLVASSVYQNRYSFDEAPAPLSGNTPGSSSQFSSSPFGTTLTPPGPSLVGNIPQLSSELEATIFEPTAADPAPVASSRHTRGPNKRPPGTGFADLLVRFISFFYISSRSRLFTRTENLSQNKLPWEVRVPLENFYTGCCQQDVKPGQKPPQKCSRQKHLFSLRHCRNLEEDMQKLLPFFVCPAFIAHHAQCRSAK